MQHLFIENLRIGFQTNVTMALKLAGAVDAADMVAQPAPGMNHPAWILKHLSAYHPAVIELLTGGDPIDPKDARFGMTSEPQSDPAVYGPWDLVVAEYRDGAERALAALDNADTLDPGLLRAPRHAGRTLARAVSRRRRGPGLPAGLPRELPPGGQLSAWRRARGLPRL